MQEIKNTKKSVRDFRSKGVVNYLLMDPEYMFKESVFEFYTHTLVYEDKTESTLHEREIMLTDGIVRGSLGLHKGGIILNEFPFESKAVWKIIKAADHPEGP